MKLLIIPKPVLNRELAVVSYCFRFHQADEYLNVQKRGFFSGGVISSPCLEALETVGVDGFTNGLPIFVPIHSLILLTDIPRYCSQPPNKIIFLLDDDTMFPEEPFIGGIKRLKKLGYRIALENISDYEKMLPVIRLCDFILLDCTASDYNEAMIYMPSDCGHLSYIATNVNNTDMFNNIKGEFGLFEGGFYSIPVTKGNRTISAMKANQVQLLNIVRNEDFEIADVAEIVSKDITMSILLLKFVNSPYIGVSSKIKTIQQAVTLLGQIEIRKWVATAIAGMLASDKPNEISKLSLMRAKFAENLADYFGMGAHASSLFLMGLFSILDVVLEIPLSEALNAVKVADDIFAALVYMEGELAKVMKFILVYERAEWDEVYKMMILCDLNTEDVFTSYIDAAGWYNSIISANTDTSTDGGDIEDDDEYYGYYEYDDE